jgi:hypothetical protein
MASLPSSPARGLVLSLLSCIHIHTKDECSKTGIKWNTCVALSVRKTSTERYDVLTFLPSSLALKTTPPCLMCTVLFSLKSQRPNKHLHGLLSALTLHLISSKDSFRTVDATRIAQHLNMSFPLSQAIITKKAKWTSTCENNILHYCDKRSSTPARITTELIALSACTCLELLSLRDGVYKLFSTI